MACLVCCWIRPAIAIEPPEGISSVVSARRVLIDGIVSRVSRIRLRQRDRFSCRQLRDFGHHPQADPAFAQHHRREVQRDAEFLEADLASYRSRGRRVAGVARWTREFAAGEEGCRSRRRSRSGWVRPACGSTPALSIARRVAVTDGVASERDASMALPATRLRPQRRERVAVGEVHAPRCRSSSIAAEVDAQLLDDVALDFGDGDLEHDLVAAAHRDAC